MNMMMSPPPDRQASQIELGADKRTNSQLKPKVRNIKMIKSEDDFYISEEVKPLYDENDVKSHQSPNSSGQQWK